MSQQLLEQVEKASLQPNVPAFEIGDTVDVHCRILEGEKERIQIFSGVVIARSGSGTREMFIVRRIVQGEGVERKFPLHSPRIAKIEVKRSGVVHRAKLYYLRDRVGKAVRLKERRGARASNRPKTRPSSPPTPGLRPLTPLSMLAWLRTLVKPKSLGQRGEAAAARYLKRRGYKIVARSDRAARGELDLVAVDGRTVVFVEVKTRQSQEAGNPGEAVGRDKQRRITRLALSYLKRHDLLGYPTRFDVVAVTWPPKQSQTPDRPLPRGVRGRRRPGDVWVARFGCLRVPTPRTVPSRGGSC